MSTLISGLGGKCLDVSHNDKANGTPVILWSNHGGLNQQWELTADGHLVSKSALGKCLATSSSNANNGDQIIIEDINGSLNQKWHFQPNGNITSQMNPDKCIDVDHGIDANGSRIILWGKNGGLNQIWNLIGASSNPIEDGVLINSPSDHAVYITEGGKRRWIPNPHTFNALGYSWDNIQSVSGTLLNSIPLGNPIPSVDRLIAETGEDVIPDLGYMNTRVGLTISTGRIDAITRTRAITWFRGFHGGVGIIPVDIDGFSVIDYKLVNKFGVDGTVLGTSDRTDPWSKNISPDEAARVEEIHIFHSVVSEDFEALLERWLNSGKTIAEFLVSIAGVAQAFKGK
jgi:Ricin-type beta-trefoil lectin domain